MIARILSLFVPRIARAQAEYDRAYRARKDAEARRDTRSMHETGHALRVAHIRLLEAEMGR